MFGFPTYHPAFLSCLTFVVFSHFFSWGFAAPSSSAAPTGLASAVLVHLTAPGCIHCERSAPLMRELESQGYPIRTIDLSREPEWGRRLQVSAMPTFVMIAGNEEVDRVVGGGDPVLLRSRICKMFELAQSHLRKKGMETGLAASSVPRSLATADQAISPFPVETGFSQASTCAPFSGTCTSREQTPSSMRSPDAWTGNPHDAKAAPEKSISGFIDQREKIESGLQHAPSRPSDFCGFVGTTPGKPGTDIVDQVNKSSVRLRVDDPSGQAHSWGTGTIIDARGGMALILTCGHIFRESRGEGDVEVHLFRDHSEFKVLGRCIRYDLEIDLALVKIMAPCPLEATPILSENASIVAGEPVFSVGCDGGADPSVREHHIKSLDRIGTPRSNVVPFHYIQVSGAPVSGRSGGGLFNKQGCLIGVCSTADPQENAGHFVPPHIIREVLDRANLSAVYHSPSLSDPTFPVSNSAVNSVAGSVAAPVSVPSPPVASFEPLKPIGVEERSGVALPESAVHGRNKVAVRQTMNEEEIATLQEIERHRQDGNEVILIIRSRHTPETPSDVIVLRDASEAFVKALSQQRPGIPGAPENKAAFDTARTQAVSFPVSHR